MSTLISANLPRPHPIDLHDPNRIKQMSYESRVSRIVNFFLGLGFATLGSIGASSGMPLTGSVTILYGATLACYHGAKMVQTMQVHIKLK